MSSLRTILVTLLLVGCSPALTFRIDGPATPEQVAALADRAARWNRETDAKHKLRIDAKGDYAVSFVESIPTADGPMAGRECTRVGADCPNAPTVRVLRSLTGVNLARVLLHELGHTLGLRHLADPNALMQGPGPIRATDLTPADITECRRAGACGSITTRTQP